MNLNELNKIEEGIFSAIKDRFQQGGYQTRVQNIFITDFVQDAITSLNNGVKGGLIDPNIKSTGVAPSSPASVSGAEPATSEPGVQKMTPAQMTAAKAQNKIAPGTATGTSPTPKLTPRDRLMLQRQAKAVKESSYDKMNRIFESIINLDEETELRTISDFMMDWFKQYMQGVEWAGSQAIIKQKLDQLQKEYPNNVKQNLTDLARMGLALSKAGSPAGAPAEFTRAKKDQESSVEDLKSALDGLAKSDPKAFNELIKNLKPVQTGFFSEDTQ